MTEKPAVDWEGIERDYRAGLLTLRQIGEQHGVTHGAINKRAKRDGWDRDLSAKIKAKAESLVSKQAVSKEVSKERKVSEQAIIEANAQAITNVILSHRTGIGRLRAIAESLMVKLELPESEIKFPDQVASVKSLSETLKNLIGLERQAFNVDQAGTPKEGIDTDEVPVLEVARRILFLMAGANKSLEKA